MMTRVSFETVTKEFRPVAMASQLGWPQLFIVLWLFIIGVSVIDSYLVLECRDQLVELNPQGRLLIQLNHGHVWYLLIAKFLGTVVAGAVLLIIWRNSVHLGTAVAVVVAALQFCLLLFLSLC